VTRLDGLERNHSPRQRVVNGDRHG
jgi:hypothetical protein